MTWRETRRVPTPAEPTVSQTFRLEYTSLCRYRLTLLEHVTPPPPGAPHVAGTSHEADGQTVRSYEPWRTPPETVGPLDPRNCLTPEEHLLIPVAMPASVRTLSSLSGWQRTELGDGLARLSRNAEHPGPGGVIHEHVEVTYREADGLPVLVVSTANGVEVQRRDVLELHVKAP
jgi:hypothetical protein